MLIDTHCHLHDNEFFTPDQQNIMLARAKANGVEKIICIGTNHEDSLAAQRFAEVYEDVFWTYGVHPNEWKNASQPDVNHSSRLVGIGEIGLDYHYGDSDSNQQIRLFRTMLELAQNLNLPVSFHIREAFDDFFTIIKDYPKIRGVIHSFSDSKKNLKKLLENTDFYIGVNGMATYSTLPTPPLERILLETDAPFLTPAPFRGIINEPSYIKTIAEWLSTKLGVSVQKVAEITTSNANQLYRIQNSSCTRKKAC